MSRDPLTRQMLTGTIPERFRAKVDVGPTAYCWEWTAAVKQNGYGELILWRGRTEAAHRIAWVLQFGDIPAGMCVCHKCDNPPCCNPWHLFLGTRQDNMDDMVAKGRQGHNWGERNPGRLTAKHLTLVKEMRLAGATQMEIAKAVGATQSWVSDVLAGRLRTHG